MFTFASRSNGAKSLMQHVWSRARTRYFVWMADRKCPTCDLLSFGDFSIATKLFVANFEPIVDGGRDIECRPGTTTCIQTT